MMVVLPEPDGAEKRMALRLSMVSEFAVEYLVEGLYFNRVHVPTVLLCHFTYVVDGFVAVVYRVEAQYEVGVGAHVVVEECTDKAELVVDVDDGPQVGDFMRRHLLRQFVAKVCVVLFKAVADGLRLFAFLVLRQVLK